MKFTSLSDLQKSFLNTFKPSIKNKLNYSPEELLPIIGELSRGGVHTICGRPGSGKTSLMIELALQAAARKTDNIPVYIFSLEASAEMLAKRFAECCYARTENSKDTGLQFSSTNTEEIIENLNIFICDETKISVGDVCEFASSLEKGIIFVDYVQLLSSYGLKSTDTDLSENAADSDLRSLKKYVDNNKNPIVLLSQLGRRKAILGTNIIESMPILQKCVSTFETTMICLGDSFIKHIN